jgi:hypothetical protein
MPKTEGRLPDFIIVGATKAGTTSLDFYLSLHPEIHMARPKEPRFFIDAKEPFGRWSRGLDWYKGLFRSEKKVCGESSPAYTHWPVFPGVPERMARLVPKAKLIYLVREPMDRLKSHFLMQCRQDASSKSLNEVVAGNPAPRCLLASFYGSQLENFLQWFSMDQILVLESDHLMNARGATIRRVFEFLSVDPGFKTPLFTHRRNVSNHQSIPNSTGRKILNSPWMKNAQTRLPDSLFYHLKNLLLIPFSANPPSMELSKKIHAEVQRRLFREVALIRKQAGQALDSLGYA